MGNILLQEHRKFRNQCIGVTVLLFLVGLFMKIPFDFFTEDASTEGAGTFFGFAVIMLFVSIWNIFSYEKNKRAWKEHYENK